MEATYQPNESELTYQFLQGLKKTFRGKKVKISISEEKPHEMAYENFENKILDAEKSAVSYVFEGDAFEEYTRKKLAGESVNANEFQQVRP